MNTAEKLSHLSSAYKTKKVDDEREEIIVINDESPIHDSMRDMQFKLNEETGTFELDYEIMSTACSIMSDVDIKDLEDADLTELSRDTASIWINARLGYLNMNNHADVYEIMKEYEADIQDGCAIWFERQVEQACETIRAWALSEEE